MPLPFFYKEDITANSTAVVLDEPTSKHIVQVLRMQTGEQLQLTDGNGNLFTCEITDNNRKKCLVTVQKTINYQPPTINCTIAISLVKNATRFEWFLEKATEIGVSEIIPLVCERTEKEKFRFERLNGICISAMLQSQQTWLPALCAPVEFDKMVLQKEAEQKFIAHCIDNGKQALANQHNNTSPSSLICIGPEGDFTKAEIELALKNNFMPVSLGNTRLRTETAGVVAAALLVAGK